MNRIPTLVVLGLLAVLITAGFTAYMYFGQGSLVDDAKKYDAKIATAEDDLKKFQSESSEVASKAKEALGVVKSDYIKWSSVIESILATTPKDPATKNPLVEYTSYSGAAGSKISINARTVALSKNPFADVASLIRSFNESSDFRDPFVPSISTAFTDDGSMLLVFSFSVDYKPGSASPATAGGSASPELEPEAPVAPAATPKAPKVPKT